jgi:hypothetical protein
MDIHDTSNCPVAEACIECGQIRELRAATVWMEPVGIACVTLCPTCIGENWLPRMTLGQAARYVEAHTEHVGIAPTAP